jgi:mono/diheme cytochrome c family protein
MNEKEQKEYLEEYHKAKEKGVPFFPDIIFKDAVVTLVVFLILVALAYFVGTPLEGRANPADATYTPRPEWYFLFLFQLLKYFPGNLEVIGVVLIPTLVILLLVALPFLDRSPRRHFRNRPVVVGAALIGILGISFLTVQAVRESPPPAATDNGDQTATLYARNCANCHGATIDVPEGTNLHAVIAQGKHEGMPAWSADLTTDQIDALAGFILSPVGSTLFTQNCGGCHQVSELISSDPLQLKNVLDQGPAFPAHVDQNVPKWSETLNAEARTSLLNFLIAPDGQRLFTVNCSPCHGLSVAFSGSEQELRQIISQGGLHLEMPPWQEKLDQSQIDTLAHYVVDPSSVPQAKDLFEKDCSTCHGDRIPKSPSFEQAQQAIASGGAHQTMPVWGSALTSEQLDALVSYTLDAARGTPLELGQNLFGQNCSPCHGEFGEGGPNPTRPGDVITPISTAEFLKTRDDYTLRSIISQGQPNSGMSPFGSENGGPLDEDEIDAIVAWGDVLSTEQIQQLVDYIRQLGQSAEEAGVANATPTAPPVPSFGKDIMPILSSSCTMCHGDSGGWDATNYDKLMSTGDHGPVVVPGDVDASLLAQKIQGTQTEGKMMPPLKKMKEKDIQTILDWIAAGAPHN